MTDGLNLMTWNVRYFGHGTGGVRANSIYDGETYDATLEVDGWARPGAVAPGDSPMSER